LIFYFKNAQILEQHQFENVGKNMLLDLLPCANNQGWLI